MVSMASSAAVKSEEITIALVDMTTSDTWEMEVDLGETVGGLRKLILEELQAQEIRTCR